ncbi:MAG: nitrate reductase [Comamonadaceae bacterium]|nr:MAG: nitrate reductase [Comamonadaceae bacterium]
MQETRSTCPYCGVGCGVVIQSEGTQITGVRGDPLHPANFGRLCTKGSTLHLTATQTITQQTRLLQPQWRAQRGQPPQPTTWEHALDTAAQRFAGVIERHGPDAVGFYVSGQLLTEDYYVFNKLAKGLIGTNNIDTNSRLCMSSAVAGYKTTLGADAPPACYEDVNHAQCLFIVGSNTAWAHPILMRRIEDARAANPAMKIIVADPRRTDTAAMADLFLPLQPGSDVMLFNAMLHVMLKEGWVDRDYIARHTQGFDALQAVVLHCTPERAAEVCGLPAHDIATAARWFAGVDAGSAPRRPTLSLYCQGLNQSSHGTAKNASLIHLHLATGQIGRPGAGPFSLTGQPNAMGGREVGGLANLLSAHRDLANAQHRAEVAAHWGVPDVPAVPGKTAVEMFQAAADGEIKALWIACTNPAQSMPDQATVRRALERAEIVVVQEAFATTATCAYADLLLPATTWGEKTGTVTNSERRISRVRPAVPAPGAARHDWAIAVDFAQRLQARLRPALAPLFGYALAPADTGAEAIWNEHRETTRGRDLDITGLSWSLLEAHGPQQWPVRGGPLGATAQGTPRLYTDGVFPTSDGRARFTAHAWQPTAELRDAAHPFSLNTGRLRDQWHGMSRTGTLGKLFGHAAEPSVQMHPGDMARLQLAEGDLVRLTSRRGALTVPVEANATLAPQQAFMAMHWGSEFLGGQSDTGEALAGVNTITSPAYCPTSRQPELKHAAISIAPAGLPWHLLALAWLPEDRAHTTRLALSRLLADLTYAHCVPFASAAGRTGVLVRGAAHAAPTTDLLTRIEALLHCTADDTLRYTDPRREQHRALRLTRHAHGDTTLDALLLAGDTRAGVWLRTLLQEEQPVQRYGRLLLRPGSQPPVAVASRGKPVCVCLNVTDTAIHAHLAACQDSGLDEGARLGQLQATLRCGTQCGSCLPELKRMVRSSAPAPSMPAAAAGAGTVQVA